MIHPRRLILEPLGRYLFLLPDLWRCWRRRRHYWSLTFLDQLSGLLMKSLLCDQLSLPFLELGLPKSESLFHFSKPLLLLSDLCKLLLLSLFLGLQFGLTFSEFRLLPLDASAHIFEVLFFNDLRD